MAIDPMLDHRNVTASSPEITDVGISSRALARAARNERCAAMVR